MHYGDGVMDTVASQITSLTIIYSTVYSGADQRKHQSSASLGTGEFPAQMTSNEKMFPFDDVIMEYFITAYFPREYAVPSYNYAHGSCRVSHLLTENNDN